MPLSDPQNWGKEKEGPEGENAHHRPRSRAQRDHSPEKEAGLPGCVMAPKPCKQQPTRPPLSWQLTDPSTQTSTRGTTWEGTRYCHEGNVTAKAQPETAQPSTRQCQECPAEKEKQSRRETDVKRSSTQVSPPMQGPGSPAGDGAPLREGPGAR